MSQALYRKYRSRTLDEVLGQNHVTSILKRALEKERISHAYLLTGPRGTGKTSVARILAHEINKLPYEDDSNHIDIIEIDAASNNGVDDIRSLREKARIAPVLAKYKIYIIDEVHMLSKPAFNALLKTLEEPPAHVVFILATTDADKLPSTILSRVQQYYFHPIGETIITNQLINIAEQEGFLIDKAAAKLIAKKSRGGFRDSISLLDQLSSLASSSEPLTEAQVAASLGLAGDESISRLIEAYELGKTADILNILSSLDTEGFDPSIISSQLISELRTRLADKPQLVSLISKLIGVARSPYPDMHLLTALINPPEPTQSTAKTAQPVKPSSTATSKPQPAIVKEEPPATPEVENKPSQSKATAEDAPKKSTQPISGDFDWQKFIDQAKQSSMGLFSLLSGCDYDFSDGTLTIYAGTPFAKKKLSDVKNLPLISAAIQTSQGGEAVVIIKSGKKPPKDERLAEIANMMGGGEEVDLGEIS